MYMSLPMQLLSNISHNSQLYYFLQIMVVFFLLIVIFCQFVNYVYWLFFTFFKIIKILFLVYMCLILILVIMLFSSIICEFFTKKLMVFYVKLLLMFAIIIKTLNSPLVWSTSILPSYFSTTALTEDRPIPVSLNSRFLE